MALASTLAVLLATAPSAGPAATVNADPARIELVTLGDGEGRLI